MALLFKIFLHKHHIMALQSVTCTIPMYILSFTCDKVMERNSGSYRHVSSDPDLQNTYRLSHMKLDLSILCTKLGVLDY